MTQMELAGLKDGNQKLRPSLNPLDTSFSNFPPKLQKYRNHNNSDAQLSFRNWNGDSKIETLKLEKKLQRSLKYSRYNPSISDYSPKP